MASATLSHISRDMPSFSVALAQSSPSGDLVEVLSMQDFGHASRRELHFNFQPRDHAPFMMTVDTRSPGSFAYDAEYSHTKTGTHSTTSITSSSTSFSASAMEHSDETSSSASTTELDLNREFKLDLDADSGSDTATLSDCDVDPLGGRSPPLNHQPASLTPLAQAPSLPPRYRKFEADIANGIPMRVPGYAGSSSSPGQDSTARGSESSSGRAPPEYTSPSGRLTGFNILLAILNAFRSLWRRLRKVGGSYCGFDERPVVCISPAL